MGLSSFVPCKSIVINEGFLHRFVTVDFINFCDVFCKRISAIATLHNDNVNHNCTLLYYRLSCDKVLTRSSITLSECK